MPFSDLALCPKPVIAFLQNPNFEELEEALDTLKLPTVMKRNATLVKMTKLAEKQV